LGEHKFRAGIHGGVQGGVMKLLKDLAIVAALLMLAAASFRLAALFGTVEARVAAINPKHLENAVYNVAALTYASRTVAADLADERTGVARTLRNVNVITAQLGRTANEARLASTEERKAVLAISTDLGAAVREIRDGVGPILAAVPPVLSEARSQLILVGGAASGTLQEAQYSIHTVTPFATGTVAAAKVTLGHFAQSSITFQESWPHIINGVDRLVANSDRTTDASARLVENLQTASKPLPKWLRVALAVAPPLAGVGASAVAAGAAAGAFR
jgi:hypothetical protein